MRSETITGFRYGLGVTRRNHRVSGVVGVYVPWKANPQRLQIITTYINGKGHSAGEGDAGGLGPDAIHGSKAYGIAADSTTKNNRWRFRAEYAQSEFDFDGINTGFEAEKDYAYALLAMYTAKEKVIKKNPLTWNVSVEHKRHGAFYRTLTNPGLPSDRLITRLNFNWNFKGYTLAGSIGQDQDNVDDDTTVPQTSNTLFSFTLNYAPTTDAGTVTDDGKKKKKKTNFFAQPNYSVSYSRTDQLMKRIPVTFVGKRVDTINDVISFNASFTPGKWSWSFGQQLAFVVDDSTPLNEQNNSNNYTTQISLTYPVSERLSLNPTLQYNIEENETTNVDTKTTTLGISSNFVLKKDKLSGTLNYSYNQTDTSDNSNNTEGSTVDLGLTYTLKQAKENKPGVTWFLNGNWQDSNTEVDTYQIFTGIQIGWTHSR
jgi:hypothetical protein